MSALNGQRGRECGEGSEGRTDYREWSVPPSSQAEQRATIGWRVIHHAGARYLSNASMWEVRSPIGCEDYWPFEEWSTGWAGFGGLWYHYYFIVQIVWDKKSCTSLRGITLTFFQALLLVFETTVGGSKTRDPFKSKCRCHGSCVGGSKAKMKLKAEN